MFRRSRQPAQTPEEGEQQPPELYNEDFDEDPEEEADAPLPTAEEDLAPEPPAFLRSRSGFAAEEQQEEDGGGVTETFAPAQAPVTARRETPAETVPQFDAMTARIPERSLENATVIGPETTIEGTLRSAGNLRVLGSISGALDVGGVLVIERGGRVDAQVDAGSVRVHGQLEGDVRCHDRLDVGEGSRIQGSFSTPTLLIEEGAEVRGKFAMRSRTESRPVAAKQPTLLGMEARSR